MTIPYEAKPLPQRDPALDVSENHYWRYHRLDALLECKQPVTASADEDLFIAVHQVCELSFNQMIIDMARALDALDVAMAAGDPIGDTQETCYFLDRVLRFWDVVNRTMPILNGMRGFAEFRTAIGPGSGFQSWQFRHLEIMSGIRHAYWKGGTNDAGGRPHVAESAFDRRHGEDQRRWFAEHEAHSLAHYWGALKGRAAGDDPVLALEGDANAAALLKRLRRYEAAQQLFHQAHLALAVRQLKLVGVEIGTGGSSFKTYLAKYGQDEARIFEGLAAYQESE
jgi:tryptophan 2,3-dioxygenase